ncbi:MAG TPA: hypothetical protein VES92_12405, partial [Nitrospiraceae bacterium]|nr:hypothetical protein [Nitrospiraceae bacterium]
MDQVVLVLITLVAATINGAPTISLDSTAPAAWRSFRLSSPASFWEFLSGAVSFVGWTLKCSGCMAF